MNAELFKNFPMSESYQTGHLSSMATYYRLYMTEVLPSFVSKVLYLDGDIIVRDSLKLLWNTDISGVAVAAVTDTANNTMMPYDFLRYSPSLGYFNAGVLLINLDYWRENRVLDTFLQFVREHPERLHSHDQDVLNYCFRNAKITLPIKYNVMTEFSKKDAHNWLSWEYEEQLEEAQKHPVIVHFAVAPKPWHSDCPNPYR